MQLPKMVRVSRRYAVPLPCSIEAEMERGFTERKWEVGCNRKIAVGVGSRGIANLPQIVSSTLNQLKRRGASPFIFPAMGSHGGATATGQRELLFSLGISEKTMGVPILDSMDVVKTGCNELGVEAYCAKVAMESDGILLINRIKPHTDFFGDMGSGILKMSVIGLGKRQGAMAMHLGALKYGYETTLRSLSKINCERTPFLGGIGIVENQHHETTLVQVLSSEDIVEQESKLFRLAKSWMPNLPFSEVDLLVVDRIGKNISGAGMDPNVIGRSIHGYSSTREGFAASTPWIHRIYVRGLTDESKGNGIGIGMADGISQKLTEQMDLYKTQVNALTALTLQSCKIPIQFANDRLAIRTLLDTLPTTSDDKGENHVRIVRIPNTLELTHIEVSSAVFHEYCRTEDWIQRSEPFEIPFDQRGNLEDLR